MIYSKQGETPFSSWPSNAPLAARAVSVSHQQSHPSPKRFGTVFDDNLLYVYLPQIDNTAVPLLFKPSSRLTRDEL